MLKAAAAQTQWNSYSVDRLSLKLCNYCNEVVHGSQVCERQISVIVLMGVFLPGSLADLGLISATSCMIDK